RPLLVSAEDVHWADEASLDFLIVLARAVRTRPILLLLSYRSDEPRPALADLLAALDRERLAAELRLQPLGRTEVGRMLAATHGADRPPPLELAESLRALTDGNPFFIEEVLRSLIVEGSGPYATGRWAPTPLAELRT